MVILSADDWVCIFVLSVVWMRILHRVLRVLGCWWVLYSSGFLCGSSCYLILPRVSSPVVQGLRFSAPTAEAQGCISPVPAQGAPCVLILEAWALKVSVSETLGPPCSDDGGQCFSGESGERLPVFLRGNLPTPRAPRRAPRSHRS